MPLTRTDRQRRVFWLFLVFAALVSFACVAYPLYVIRPFRAQGPRELAAALAVLQHSSFITGACVGLALVMWMGLLIVQRRWLTRIGATLIMLLVCAFAWAAHVNVYELMFHPMGQPSFKSAARTKLDGAEEVIAVQVHGVARAYPVRIISYHHIVNDTVGGVPIVA